jgi:hypothetical protein
LFLAVLDDWAQTSLPLSFNDNTSCSYARATTNMTKHEESRHSEGRQHMIGAVVFDSTVEVSELAMRI